MSASFLSIFLVPLTGLILPPSVLVPLTGLIFPAVAFAFMLIYIERDDIG